MTFIKLDTKLMNSYECPCSRSVHLPTVENGSCQVRGHWRLPDDEQYVCVASSRRSAMLQGRVRGRITLGTENNTGLEAPFDNCTLKTLQATLECHKTFSLCCFIPMNIILCKMAMSSYRHFTFSYVTF